MHPIQKNPFVQMLRQMLTSTLPPILQAIPGMGVRIVLENGTAPRGGTIRGSAIAVGYDAQRRLQNLSVELCDTTSGRRRSSLTATRLGCHNMQAVPGGIRADFVLEVPHDAPISRDIAGETRMVQAVTTGWLSGMTLARVPVTISPHREFLAVEQALERMGFRRRTSSPIFAVRTHFRVPTDAGTVLHRAGLLDALGEAVGGPQDSTVTSTFSSPPHLKGVLDGVTLAAEVRLDRLVGAVTINWAQHGLRERLGALLGRDKDLLPISIPRAALIDEQGRPDAEAALPLIRQDLDRCIAEKTDPHRELLRPADAPLDTSPLLRPAGAGEAETRGLVRPVHDEPIIQQHLDP